MDLKDQIYINIAKESAKLSKDKNTKVGCVIVDKNGIVVSSGRNGHPSGFDDSYVPLSREKEKIGYYEGNMFQESFRAIEENKYPFMLHSEINAILYADDRSRLNGATLYCTGLPCPACSLVIAQSKISRVVVDDENNIAMIDDKQKHLTKFIFVEADIKLQIGDKEIGLNRGFRK